MTPGFYNQNMQLFQTPDHVVVLNEMVHDSRIIPLDGRPRPDIESWTGESRGVWEGDTLVVETTHFSDKHGYRGSTRDRHLIERFTRVDADTLLYEFTISDPATWSAPWTARIPMKSTELLLFEYACHEGNYAMPNILGVRAWRSGTPREASIEGHVAYASPALELADDHETDPDHRARGRGLRRLVRGASVLNRGSRNSSTRQFSNVHGHLHRSRAFANFSAGTLDLVSHGHTIAEAPDNLEAGCHPLLVTPPHRLWPRPLLRFAWSSRLPTAAARS